MYVQIRDNCWLQSRLASIWASHFPDVTEDNPLTIRFGRLSKFRLGSIKLTKKTNKSIITITGMFKDRRIPSAVVNHTLAHELVHYAHGFSSKRTRLHKYPHAGGVVQKEMEKRGMGNLIKSYKEWIKRYRKQFSAHV